MIERQLDNGGAVYGKLRFLLDQISPENSKPSYICLRKSHVHNPMQAIPQIDFKERAYGFPICHVIQ